MKAIRKPLIADCYKFDGDTNKLKTWLKRHRCSEIVFTKSIEDMTIAHFEYKGNKAHINLFANWYILATTAWYGSVFTIMSDIEFDYLYTTQR